MERIGSNEGDSPRKLLRRKSSHRRKPTQDCVINMDEARREVAYALHLHRSSSSICASKIDASMLDNRGNRYDTEQPSFATSNSHLQYYGYSLTSTLPTPEPVWSTTAPSVLAVSPPVLEAQEFEVGEIQAAASYSWWIGFLRNLDSNAIGVPKNQLVADYNINNNIVMGCSRVFGQCQNVTTLGGPLDPMETSDHSSCMDEWFNVSNY